MSQHNDNTTLVEARTRAQETLRKRLEQGFTAHQIARAGEFSSADELTDAIESLGTKTVPTSLITQIAQALWLEDLYLLTGEGAISTSPCSAQRLVEGHYGRFPSAPNPVPAPENYPIEDRFVPDWDQLKELWMNRMFYTSFVERYEYELGFEKFRNSHAQIP